MAEMLDTTAVENEKKALQLLVDEYQKADDNDKELLRDAIQAQAEKLDAVCKDLQAKADAIKPPDAPEDPAKKAVVEVVLTPEQRARVKEKTGIDVPSVRISDPTSNLTKNMPAMKPEFIEERAIHQANVFKKLVAEAEETADTDDEIDENDEV